MKKSFCVIISILANATLLSLGIECLLNLLGFSMAISLDSTPSYPRFIPFCIVLGIVTLLGLIAMLVLNIKASKKLNFTRPIWLFEYILAFVLSIPMIKLWEMLFDFLQKNILVIYFGHQTQKNSSDLASGAKGQFYKNTVYFERDMPYSCFS